ncbi:DUF4012 domain-containing protein [Patescibacteria group bacterium]|nr:DUF4012 domain-containing protein [Patescibacteria group bacterium]
MPEDLKRIDLATMAPAEPPKPEKPSRKLWVFIGAPLVVILILFGVLGILLLPMRTVIADARAVMTSGRETATAIKSQDIGKTKTALADTRAKLTILKTDYAKVLPLAAVPILGSYIQDGRHGINAGFAGLDAADKAVEALEPNADLLGLKGKSTFVSGTADDRIQTAVRTMSALIPKINDIAVSVDVLRKELDAIDPNRYPEKIGSTPVRSQLVSAKNVIENAANLFVNAQPLLVNLPSLLGDPTDKRYLVLFQNDKELRPTGGFITAYAQFRFVKGKAILEKADDIYALDAAQTKVPPAPPDILKFHKGVYTFNLRDSNLSPDFKISMQTFESLYKTVSGHEQIDGIWAIDTHVLVDALKILGPITVYGREFSADNDPRCDCPKAIYELEDYSSRPVNYVRTARKDIIGVLMQTILHQALGVSPSKYWGRLFQMLLTEISQKHVLAYFHDQNAQKAAESFNLAGRIMTASESAAVLKYKEGQGWDYLHVNNSNMAGAKSNMFVSEKVKKEVTVNGDGTITTKLTLEYKNPYPGSDCGLESGGLCLNAPLRDWIRIYVPKGSTLVDSQGSQSPQTGKPVPLDTFESLDKTVFQGFLIVNPLGTAQMTLSYTSPVKSTDGKYRILIQKQPGTDGQHYTVDVTGKRTQSFPLQTDTELTF